jgi:hypothetical protein
MWLSPSSDLKRRRSRSALRGRARRLATTPLCTTTPSRRRRQELIGVPSGATAKLSSSSTGDWREYTREAVVAEIRQRAEQPDLSAAESASADGRAAFDTAKGDVLSILTAFTGERPDELITGLKERTEKLVVRTAGQYARSQLPGGQYMSRDSLAINQGLQVAPHLDVQAKVLGIQAPFRLVHSLQISPSSGISYHASPRRATGYRNRRPRRGCVYRAR